MQYNGGSVIAMAGKDCVAIASDLRFGTESLGISSDFKRVIVQDLSAFPSILTIIQVFPVTDRLYVGLPGLATDVTTL